ncbi:MAG TPA: hypothetical protein DCR14_17345 [Acidimicrobiaceae bacterium]|nr:hypothetical protein [Acidimicrobiaceae bacterium]
MCGIVAIVSRPATRPVPADATVLALLDAAVAAPVHDAAAPVAEVDELLKGVPGMAALVGRHEFVAAISARLDQLEARIADRELELEAGVGFSPEALEAANASLLAMRDAVWAVRRFVEKPSEETARRLRERGAVWNTFIATGPVAAFWELARLRLPRHAIGFEMWADSGDRAESAARLRSLYAELSPASWSVDVLSRSPVEQLALVSMAGSGWSDWGSPRRVFESMSGSQDLDRLLARVTSSERPVPRA